MKVNLIYQVKTNDNMVHKFETIEGAKCFYEGCERQLACSKEHCNTTIHDQWPILRRNTIAYNGFFEETETLVLRTYCFKNPKGKNNPL